MASRHGRQQPPVRPVPLKTQVAQIAATVPLRALGRSRWLTWLRLASAIARRRAARRRLVADQCSWWIAGLAGWLLLTPPGRMLLAALGARIAAASRHARCASPRRQGPPAALACRASRRRARRAGLAGAPWIRRTPGARRAASARTSICTAFRRSPGCSRSATAPRSSRRSTSPGHWIDGDVLHVGTITVGADARIGARSMLGPAPTSVTDAEIAPGSAVFGAVPGGRVLVGRTAPGRRGRPADPGPRRRASRRRRWTRRRTPPWRAVIAAAVLALCAASSPCAALPLRCATPPARRRRLRALLLWLPVATLVGSRARCCWSGRWSGC